MFCFEKIFNKQQIREADLFTIEHEPISSISLMERAAVACCQQLEKDFETAKHYTVICGQGNNGGDGMAIARLLAEKGNCNKVDVYLLAFSNKISTDCEINWTLLQGIKNVRIFEIDDNVDLHIGEECDIIIDAIFGIGLSNKVEGKYAEVITTINQCKKQTIVSIDVPSGLFCDTITPSGAPVVKADLTYSFQFPKLAFMFAESASAIGDFKVIPIGIHEKYIKQTPSKYYYITEKGIDTLREKRAKFSHKGTYGHAFIVAGSYGKIGSAILASKACLRSGVGLLTTHLPEKGVAILQTVLPEAMASIDSCETEISSISHVIAAYTAIGIGPGIGTSEKTKDAFFDLLSICKIPMVVDADALNILSKNKDWLHLLPEGTILSPHVKEFERLAGKSENAFERLKFQSEFSKKHNVVVILKGAHTSICSPSGEIFFNSTGNAGMATAGSGDVLTGVLTAYLAKGYTPLNAALMAVFDHGKAGDKAAILKGQQAMIASDIIENL